MMKIFKQLLKFGITGIINNIIALGVYYFVVFLNPKWYLMGNILGYVLSVLNAYLLNSRFVFKDKKEQSSEKQIIKTYISYTVTLVISLFILFVCVEIYNISEKIAPIIALMITVPLNFLANKKWVYKEQL